MRNKAIILSRVSSNHQTLEQQTEAVLKEVRRDGYTDDNIIIIEDKESAIKLSEEERNGLNKMKEYIKNDPSINAVYLYELSRLSRRQLVLFSIRDFLIERGIQLVCVQPPMKLLDEDGKMSTTAAITFALYSTLSETEMTVKKERMMRGRLHNKQMGKTMSGRPPFGYAINKEKYFIVDPITSKIVERFFLQYSKGDTTIAQIAKELKEEGLFPKTSFDTLQQNLILWLDRDYYIGKFPYPQIISKSLFYKVQSVRKKRKGAPKKKYSNRFLLKGVLFNGKNGRMMCICTLGDTYTMSNTENGGLHISRTLIDPLVWDYAKDLYRQYIMNPTILIRQLQKELAIINKKVNTIRNEISSIVERVDKVEERMIFGSLSKSRGEELIEQQKELLSDKKRRLTELTNETAYKQQQIMDAELIGNINEDTMTLDDKIDIVKKVIKKVNVVRLSKYTAHITIFNRINDMVTVYELKSNIRSKDRGWRKKEEYHLKEKKTS